LEEEGSKDNRPQIEDIEEGRNGRQEKRLADAI
jgi:hypothetical protein